MSTISTDMQLRLSGGATNTNPQLSLGGVMSSTQIPGNLFDLVPPAETAAGRVEFRTIYVYNNRTTTLKGARAWISNNTSSAATRIDIGLGVSGPNGTEPSMATEGAAPPGVSFVAASDVVTGLVLGDIPANQKYPILVRWSVNAGAVSGGAQEVDTATLRIEGAYEQ